MKKLTLFLCILILTSCATIHTDTAKVPEGISVKENKIYIKGVLYAEVLKLYPNNKFCRGIAIHYFPSGSYEWISPEGGIQLKDLKTGKVITDIPTVIRLWDRFQPEFNILKNLQPIGGDSYYKMDWRSDILISDDGQFISYIERTTSDLFERGTKKTYKVSY